jgi:hypothetical protein
MYDQFKTAAFKNLNSFAKFRLLEYTIFPSLKIQI